MKKGANDILQQSNSSNMEEVEAQIDKIVYELYGLTDEDIKIVEEI